MTLEDYIRESIAKGFEEWFREHSATAELLTWLMNNDGDLRFKTAEHGFTTVFIACDRGDGERFSMSRAIDKSEVELAKFPLMQKVCQDMMREIDRVREQAANKQTANG